jgi:RNA polymerase sigma-70 factor, ECF subfamily
MESDWSEASDSALMVGIGRWREAALAEAYRRHGGAVHALGRRLLGGDGRADDVTQEVFVDLWQRPERFDASRGTLRAFVITLAHSRAVDRLRADAARSSREERDARQTADAGYDVENEVWDLAMAEKVRRALSLLADGERQAIEMSYFGGHSYREVALLLGEPEGTIKSRIRTGLRRLRAGLADAGFESAWIES